MFRFEKLNIWSESIDYAKDVYQITKKFPKEEMYGMTSQIRRASVSISSNIAEGSGSSTKKDFMHFLDISVKSAIETVSQLSLALELGYVSQTEFENLYTKAEVLIKRIKAFKNTLR